MSAPVRSRGRSLSVIQRVYSPACCRSRVAVLFILLVGVATACSPISGPAGSAAGTVHLEAFRADAARILDETGVPGAGIALVRAGGVEWAGGVGLADRDQRTPVTADTHFRAGSISKTFVAMALVQQYEDGEIDIEAPVSELAPSVPSTTGSALPVTVLNLLQHTAGFDDMHFNERYNLTDPPDLPLLDVLARNPGVAPRALAAGHAHVLFESGLRRGRRGPRAGDRTPLRRRHRASASSRRLACTPAVSC